MIETPNLEILTSQKPKVNSKFAKEVIEDYWIGCVSREVSLLGRREVLTGKAKFGILGDGKEVPQLALAKVFNKGDWRSGYYRDQTLMFALGISEVKDFFAQLYADTDNDPFSGGRQMNAHFATANIDENGDWTEVLKQYNTSSGISSTGGQMARGLGLAFASKLYKANGDLSNSTIFSKGGSEVAFLTIGDASTSEGIFWECINAAGVLQVPMVVSVWDDGYGISVPKEYQTTKGSISKILSGFQRNKEESGWEIIKVKGHDYPGLCKAYEAAAQLARKKHVPVLVHVEDLTQPQGHSTSGSHERYKSKERLAWEQAHDCLAKMGEWMIESGISDQKGLEEIGLAAKEYVKKQKDIAWEAYSERSKGYRTKLQELFANIDEPLDVVQELSQELNRLINPSSSEICAIAKRAVFASKGQVPEGVKALIQEIDNWGAKAINSHLYAEDQYSALQVDPVAPVFSEDSQNLNGYQILNRFFDETLATRPDVVAFGEDVGNIGDVNQGFAGLQLKYGEDRVFDTGIREGSIMGQAVGLAMRGFRPIAEIQYLDYLIYGLQTLSDDLATMRYRSNNMQCAPAIIRTRGHRLEGIWHAGSPMGMLVNSLRGMHVCVPRNMTQAAGMYNTALSCKDPVLVIECLNGYRLKERLPENLIDIKVPFGVPEVLQEGSDVTLVTYGSCVRIAQAALATLEKMGVQVELVDVQTLLPFDLEARIAHSLQKTNRLIVLDEDVPGGGSAYILQQVMEVQEGYKYLDSAPRTISSKAHRPAYGSDGDYYSKPNVEDVVQAVYGMMHESDPMRFPNIF